MTKRFRGAKVRRRPHAVVVPALPKTVATRKTLQKGRRPYHYLVPRTPPNCRRARLVPVGHDDASCPAATCGGHPIRPTWWCLRRFLQRRRRRRRRTPTGRERRHGKHRTTESYRRLRRRVRTRAARGPPKCAYVCVCTRARALGARVHGQHVLNSCDVTATATAAAVANTR